MATSRHPRPRGSTIQEIVQATNLIEPKPSAINSPNDLIYFCQQAAKEEPSYGACLLHCSELLPPNKDFPDDDTEFSENVTSSFQQRSKRQHQNETDFLRISSKSHKKQRYQKPNSTLIDTTEHSMQLSEIVELVQQRISDKSGLQRRLECADTNGPYMFLRCGIPLDGYVEETGDGVTTAMGIVSLDNSVFEVILGDWGLGWCSQLIAGAPNIFVVISPQSTSLFEARIQARFRTKVSCSQFIRHLGILPSLQFLHGQGIHFSVMYQKVGDVAIIFPGSYCYGFGTGSNYSREISWAPSGWDADNVDYESCNTYCGADKILPKPRKRLQSHRHRRSQSDGKGVVSSEAPWIDNTATLDMGNLYLQEETEDPQEQGQECCRVEHVDEHVKEVIQRAQTEGDEYVRELALIASSTWSIIRRWESSRRCGHEQ